MRVYPALIDGVVIISDVRLLSIARACQILGLSTESPNAYDVAVDKGRTRMLEPTEASESFVLSSADELQPYLAHRRREEGDGRPPLKFPLIVKPVVG